MEALLNALPLMVVGLLTAQTLILAVGLAQITRISGELGHLSQRQTFLESLVKPSSTSVMDRRSDVQPSVHA